MKKKLTMVVIVLAVLCIASAGVVYVPNPLGKYLISEAKANGFVAYQPTEAYDMARRICTQCHSDERIKKYCERCGPPFIAVVPHMQSFIENYKTVKPQLKVENITEVQAAAIVQVWNAIIGNWEGDFRKEDILKLIGPYEQLKKLYLTPVEKRPIEMALMGRKDLKIGYMADMNKQLAKDPSGTAPAMEGMPDHSMHDHSMMGAEGTTANGGQEHSHDMEHMHNQ